jgi:hypothetical protein
MLARWSKNARNHYHNLFVSLNYQFTRLWCYGINYYAYNKSEIIIIHFIIIYTLKCFKIQPLADVGMM